MGTSPDVWAHLREHSQQCAQVVLETFRQQRELLSTLQESEVEEDFARLQEAFFALGEREDEGPLEAFVNFLCQRRGAQGIPISDLLHGILVIEDAALTCLATIYGSDVSQLVAAQRAVASVVHRIVYRFAEAYMEFQRDVIRQREAVVSELSTPVVEVWERVLAMPLIGPIDAARAERIMDVLLHAIVERRAQFVLLDISGVPMVDTHVANHLLRTVSAALLLGAQCFLVGIGPEIAAAITRLGIDLSHIRTFMNLKAGLEAALQEMNLRILSIEGPGRA